MEILLDWAIWWIIGFWLIDLFFVGVFLIMQVLDCGTTRYWARRGWRFEREDGTVQEMVELNKTLGPKPTLNAVTHYTCMKVPARVIGMSLSSTRQW